MNEAQQMLQFEKTARNVANALLTPQRKQVLKSSSDLGHLRSRLSTFLLLLDDEIERFENSRARAAAVALVLTADLCWQSLRTLAERHESGDDQKWIDAVLPADWPLSDHDTGDKFFEHQRRIVENAKWMFELHSALRHPTSKNAADL